MSEWRDCAAQKSGGSQQDSKSHLQSDNILMATMIRDPCLHIRWWLQAFRAKVEGTRVDVVGTFVYS